MISLPRWQAHTYGMHANEFTHLDLSSLPSPLVFRAIDPKCDGTAAAVLAESCVSEPASELGQGSPPP